MLHSISAVLPVVVAVPSGYVGVEELLQHGSKSLRLDLVRLTFQGAMLTVGESLRQRHCRRMHERERGRTVHDERWHGDASGSFGGD